MPKKCVSNKPGVFSAVALKHCLHILHQENQCESNLPPVWSMNFMVIFSSFIIWDEIGVRVRNDFLLLCCLLLNPTGPDSCQGCAGSQRVCALLQGSGCFCLLVPEADFLGDDKPPGFALWTAKELPGHCLSL